MKPRMGPLEADAMNILWAADGPFTVREVRARLGRDLAYTTVMTVLDHLHDKGYVVRERTGRAYAYAPSESREEHAAQLMHDILGAPVDSPGVLLHFVDGMSAEDTDSLRKALRRRRR